MFRGLIDPGDIPTDRMINHHLLLSLIWILEETICFFFLTVQPARDIDMSGTCEGRLRTGTEFTRDHLFGDIRFVM